MYDIGGLDGYIKYSWFGNYNPWGTWWESGVLFISGEAVGGLTNRWTFNTITNRWERVQFVWGLSLFKKGQFVEQSIDSDLVIYTNQNILSIQNVSSKTQVTVYGVTGQIIDTFFTEHDISYNLSTNVSESVIYVSIKDEESSFVKPLILER